jgi:hypothetical protein
MRKAFLALLIVTVILATIGFGAALADKGGNGNKNHHNCNVGITVVGVCIEKNHHIVQIPGGIKDVVDVGCILGIAQFCKG